MLMGFEWQMNVEIVANSKNPSIFVAKSISDGAGSKAKLKR